MNDDLSWATMKDRLAGKERGAKYQLAQKLGMNPSYFYRKLRTGVGEMSERQGRIIREFLNLQAEEAQPVAALPNRRRIPLYGFAAASDGDHITLNEGQILDYIELPMGLELGPGEYFAVRPIGSSMEPRIFAGELLVVRRKYPPAHGKDVIIEFADGHALIKTYKGERQGRVWVEQFNPPKGLDFASGDVKAMHAVAFKL